MRVPVLFCGRTYDAESIINHLKSQKERGLAYTDPLTNKKITDSQKHISFNYDLQQEIRGFFAEQLKSNHKILNDAAFIKAREALEGLGKSLTQSDLKPLQKTATECGVVGLEADYLPLGEPAPQANNEQKDGGPYLGVVAELPHADPLPRNNENGEERKEDDDYDGLCRRPPNTLAHRILIPTAIGAMSSIGGMNIMIMPPPNGGYSLEQLRTDWGSAGSVSGIGGLFAMLSSFAVYRCSSRNSCADFGRTLAIGVGGAINSFLIMALFHLYSYFEENSQRGEINAIGGALVFLELLILLRLYYKTRDNQPHPDALHDPLLPPPAAQQQAPARVAPGAVAFPPANNGRRALGAPAEQPQPEPDLEGAEEHRRAAANPLPQLN